MTKRLSIALVVALVLSVFCASAAFANCGKCPTKAGDDKAGCSHGKDAKDGKSCCPAQKDMMASMEALQKDLATMEKGIAPADQAAFMKAHQANLKKFVDSHAACQKACAAKEKAPAAKDAVKDAPKDAAKEPAKN